MGGSAWLLLPLLALPTLLGISILRRAGLALRGDLLFAAGAGYGIGAFVIAGVLMVFVGLGVPLARSSVLGAIAVLLLVAALARVRSARAPARLPSGVLGRCAFATSLSLCIGSLLAEACSANGCAIATGDEATHYFSKSCEIHSVGHFGARYSRALEDGRVAGPEYPLLDPLLQVYAHVCEGHIARVDARVPIQGFMLALVLMLAGALARRTRPWLGALILPAVLLTDTGRDMPRSAIADGIVAFGMLMATEASLELQRGSARRAAPLLAFGLAIAIWAKNEGTMLALALLLTNAAPLWRTPDRAFVLRWLTLPLAALTAHLALNLAHGLSYYMLADYGRGGVLTRFFGQIGTHGPRVIATLARELLAPARCTGGVFAALLLLALLAPKALFASGSYRPALALGAGILGYATILTGTGTDLAWSLQTATPRLWFQLAPAAALLVGTTVAAAGQRWGGMSG